jgi:addiction module RelE/StbE family toxin
MIYKVIVSRQAEMDMVEIGRYISRELKSLQAANTLQDEFDEKILDLEQMPRRYALVSDERLALLGYRAIPVKNYLIFYTVDAPAQTVMIIRVVYGARDWAHLL